MAVQVATYNTRGGDELFYRAFTPERQSAVSSIIFIHGIESHSGWWSEACEKLAGRGLEVYALDRRGSGLNQKSRGDLDDFHKLIEDIDDFFLHKELTEKKCILIGLCWGAKPALYFLLNYPLKVSKVVFITPGFKTKLRTPISKKIYGLLTLLFAPQARLKLPIEAEMFTKDETYLNMIRNDTMRLKSITSRFLKENLRMERAIRKSEAVLDIPSFLLLAEKDEIVDNNGVRTFLERYFRNLEINLYSGCRHGLFFESEREDVINDLASWILK